MSFLIYFFVLLVSAASVLFGLDLMSSPLPKTPNVPIGRSVQVVLPPPAQQREVRAADERALTPVYPAEPGKPNVQAQTSGGAPQEQAKEQVAARSDAPAPTAQPPAATVAQAPAPAPQPTPPAARQPPVEPVATAQPAPAAQPRVTEAKAEPAVAEAKVEPAKVDPVKAESAMTAQQATLHTSNSCNVQACGAAYQSFRAADCSYQPVSGPRRACTMARGATTASAPASKPRLAAREDDQTTGKGEMREVERIVKRQPLQITPSARQSASTGEMSEVERIVRHMTRDENADVAVQDGDGNVFIVRKSYR